MEREEKIYIKSGRSDMRNGIDGMLCLVAELLGEEALFNESALFLFCGRKTANKTYFEQLLLAGFYSRKLSLNFNTF